MGRAARSAAKPIGFPRSGKTNEFRFTSAPLYPSYALRVGAVANGRRARPVPDLRLRRNAPEQSGGSPSLLLNDPKCSNVST